MTRYVAPAWVRFPATILLVILTWVHPVLAHTLQVEPVAIVLRPQDTYIGAEFSGNVQDIMQIPGEQTGEAERSGDTFNQSARERIEAYVNSELRLEQGGTVLWGEITDIRYDDNVDPAKSRYTMAFRYARPPGARDEAMRVTSTLFDYLPNALTTINVGGFQRNLEPGETAEVDASDLLSNLSTNVANFLKLGMEHIFTGQDHLAFIFGLLIIAPDFRTLVKILTGFTVSHSISLIFVTLGNVELPMFWVELFVYATIIYVGFENLSADPPKHRFWYATGFGFIHGLAFGSNLRAIGLPEGNALFWSLLSFNLGVELAQVIVCAAVFPLLIWWKAAALKRASGDGIKWETVTKTVSLLIVAAGGYWMMEKLLPLVSGTQP
ncbi:MAG: HupE/UreJ family protein [Akkermansiaceae bacterium]|nr:HupE/UreJ family protein [Armatimonadota bacterium]